MKQLLNFGALAAFTLGGLATAHGATSLNFYFGAMRGVDGETLPDGTLIVLIANTNTSEGALPAGLVASTTNSGLNPVLAGEHFAGTTLEVGATINLDTIFYIGAINGAASIDPAYAGTVYDPLVTIDYGGALALGQTYGLYWFPGLTVDNNTVPSGSFVMGGFHNTDANSGDIGMVLPSDGLYDVFHTDNVTAGLDGLTSVIMSPAFTAINVPAAIPEPSTTAIIAIGMVAMMRRRMRIN